MAQVDHQKKPIQGLGGYRAEGGRSPRNPIQGLGFRARP